ncbi:MAG: type II toxin-antitoxin system Phd/YefM family antitoxin [Solirubrobacteraceae bacterium]
MGSSPTSSTPPFSDRITIGANAFRDRFGLWMEAAAAGQELLITRHGRPMVRLVPAGAATRQMRSTTLPSLPPAAKWS